MVKINSVKYFTIKIDTVRKQSNDFKNITTKFEQDQINEANKTKAD